MFYISVDPTDSPSSPGNASENAAVGTKIHMNYTSTNTFSDCTLSLQVFSGERCHFYVQSSHGLSANSRQTVAAFTGAMS